MKKEKKTLRFVVCDSCGVFLDGGAGLCSYKCKYDGTSRYERPLREEVYQIIQSKKIAFSGKSSQKSKT